MHAVPAKMQKNALYDANVGKNSSVRIAKRGHRTGECTEITPEVHLTVTEEKFSRVEGGNKGKLCSRLKLQKRLWTVYYPR